MVYFVKVMEAQSVCKDRLGQAISFSVDTKNLQTARFTNHMRKNIIRFCHN